MTELAEGPTHVGVRRSLAYWNQEFQRVHSPILRYGFSVVSVAIALGVAFALQYYQFREVELPLLTVAIALTTWYAGAGPSVLAVLFPWPASTTSLRSRFTPSTSPLEIYLTFSF